VSKSIQIKDKEGTYLYPNPYFPVGSIYLSVTDTNPKKWFGGTWEQIAKGRTLVGVDTSDSDFSTVKKTGGEKTHTLTTEEMPSDFPKFRKRESSVTQSEVYDNAETTWDNHWRETINQTTSRGSNKAHNNLQPYFTCYIWCRTA
jgi:hypothetical protein